MHWNIVELAENGRYAKVDRGFLVVKEEHRELGRTILDELSCFVISADQATVSKPLMVRLAEQGVPVIFCGQNYHPVSLTLPYSNHHFITGILNHQIQASKPLKKRLWQQLVKQKIHNQIWALTHLHGNRVSVLARMERLAQQVKSGDPENCEAQAARVYWRALLGSEFRRLPEANDFANCALNYGYTLLRAATARATCAAGLQPALGLHHHNQGNPFCLVDDLMEPFRPLVDRQVGLWMHNKHTPDLLLPEHKKALAKLLTQDMVVKQTKTPASNAMQHCAFSLVNSLEQGEVALKLPQLPVIPPDAQAPG